MTTEADFIDRPDQLRVVLRAMHIVAGRACDLMPVHYALRKIIALHPVLVSRAVGEVVEVRRAQAAVFELPVILEAQTHLIADGPVVILACDSALQWPPLRVALNADIVLRHCVHVRGVHDISADRMPDMGTARTVTAFAADVPLRRLVRLDVITDRVAAITGRPGGTLHVVVGIQRSPPVAALRGYMVGQPLALADVPLDREGGITVAGTDEVTLLPDAPVDEGHLLQPERCDRVGREIRNDGVGIGPRVAHYVRHRRLPPQPVDGRVTFRTRCRSDIMRGAQHMSLFG